jgi:hypothetical protein
MCCVRLDAVRHQIPTGHPFEDLATFGVLAYSGNHQRMRPESAQMPGHVEWRATQHTTAVGEVVEEDLAENDRSVVETVHGFLPDAFLGAGAFSPR